MPLLLFAFSIDTETNEATFAGTIEPPAALTLLQQFVIADAVKKAGSDDKPSLKV